MGEFGVIFWSCDFSKFMTFVSFGFFFCEMELMMLVLAGVEDRIGLCERCLVLVDFFYFLFSKGYVYFRGSRRIDFGFFSFYFWY